MNKNNEIYYNLSLPIGWIHIDNVSPKLDDKDIDKGFTLYIVKNRSDVESISKVTDKNWVAYAKSIGITHWFNKPINHTYK